MKTRLAAFLALIILCNIAKADQILIYSGYQAQRSFDNDNLTSVFHEFYLFDLTTLEYVSVVHQVANGAKTFTASGESPFVSAPVATSSTKSRSNFAFGNSDMSASFALRLGVFTGVNTALTLGGTFTGQYSPILLYSGHLIEGDGTTANDGAFVDRGVYRLDFVLTRASNDGSDDLTAATALVTAFLTKEGYTAQ